MAQTVFHIGELAAQGGVSIDTIRYYERRKLLPHAGRTSGGFRLYTPEGIERLRFIKQAQEIGFSLDAFYQAYKPQSVECAPGKSCRIGASRTRQRVLLWIITVITLVLLTTGDWSSWIIYWSL
jgi:DNA-binding transcriptional MerR regulator